MLEIATDGTGTATLELSGGPRAYRVADGLALAVRLNLPIHAGDGCELIPEVPTPAVCVVPSDDVVAWLRAHAHPLASCAAGTDFEDLRALDTLVADARVVGIGESTHGTSEFIRLRHRLFEYLVREHGFTAIAFEAPFGELLAVNDHVQLGEGSLDDAMLQLLFPDLLTVEMRDLIAWTREQNRTGTRVAFHGIDMQHLLAAVRRLRAYLDDIDSEYSRATPFSEHAKVTWHALEDADAVRGVAARLDAAKDAYIARSSPVAWNLARLCAEVALQSDHERRYEDEWTSMYRDRCLAENVRGLLEAYGPDARIVLCAHNRHLSREPASDGGWMRWNLNEMLGAAYIPIAQIFNEGTFRTEVNDVPRDFAVDPAPIGTFDRTLAEAGGELALFGLREVEDGSPVARWLAQEPPMRLVGIGYEHPDQIVAHMTGDPRALYDAAILVNRSTSPRRLGAKLR